MPRGYSFQFERPGTLRIDTGGSCTVYFRPGSAGPAEGTFEFPLKIRSRLPGDRLEIRDGRKPVEEILAEWRVPREWRDYVPVLEDRRGIVGILGSRAGARDRYRPVPAAPDASIPRLAVEIEGIGPFRSIERSAEAP
jgi:tRNA(Ile)-lysidine synthetase-like protein